MTLEEYYEVIYREDGANITLKFSDYATAKSRYLEMLNNSYEIVVLQRVKETPKGDVVDIIEARSSQLTPVKVVEVVIHEEGEGDDTE